MQLISPDVLAEARGLSPGAAGFLLFVGFLLWAFGWRWHRFWVVFAITLAAGLLGISAGKSSGSQVLVVGVLLAVAAGMLALELAKILAFVTGGVVSWVAAEAAFPQAQELWAIFLCGGLVGVSLYRLWTMLATSLIGILVSWHALLVMAESFASADAPKIAREYSGALNSGVIVAALLGLVVQSYTGIEEQVEEEPEPVEKKKKKSGKHAEHKSDEHHEHDDDHGHAKEKPSAKKSWFGRLLPTG